MRIRITKPGIHGLAGEIAVGTELDVKAEPTGWAGRYDVISSTTEGKTPITNPAKSAYSVKDKGAGWFVVVKDGTEVTKSLRKDALEGFDAKSDTDKAAFAEANKAEG